MNWPRRSRASWTADIAPANYAGFHKRQVASFSDPEVQSLLDGRGSGLALPAELNGYPGPAHVLELARSLALSDDQQAKVRALFARMQARARDAGAKYVAAEKALDAAFKSAAADRETIATLTREADRLRAEKRLAHLEAHIETRALLTAGQLAKYAELRGYGAGTGKP